MHILTRAWKTYCSDFVCGSQAFTAATATCYLHPFSDTIFRFRNSPSGSSCAPLPPRKCASVEIPDLTTADDLCETLRISPPQSIPSLHFCANLAAESLTRRTASANIFGIDTSHGDEAVTDHNRLVLTQNGQFSHVYTQLAFCFLRIVISHILGLLTSILRAISFHSTLGILCAIGNVHRCFSAPLSDRKRHFAGRTTWCAAVALCIAAAPFCADGQVYRLENAWYSVVSFSCMN